MIENKRLNYELISLARDYRNLTQKELSDAIGIEQGTLSKIENDILPIYQNDPLASEISKKLKFPIKFFLQNIRIYNFEIGAHARKKQSVSINGHLIAKLNLIKSNIETLLKSIEIPESKIPNIICDEQNSPQQIANQVRKLLMIREGAINNLSKILEDNGCIIYLDDLDVDGFSFSFHNHHIICLNKRSPIDRLRFTQAHELGHLVMHKNQIANKEIECEADSFASEFLMPSHLIREDFEIINVNKLHELANLKLKWKTSIQSIAMKAKDMGFLSEGGYRNLQVQISRLGYRKNEPYAFDRSIETASILREIFDYYIKSLKYNLDQLSGILYFHKEDFMEIYKECLPNFTNNTPLPKLRVINGGVS